MLSSGRTKVAPPVTDWSAHGSRDIMVPSQEEAMADFARRWRTWLEWAGLREREDEQRVRLP